MVGGQSPVVTGLVVRKNNEEKVKLVLFYTFKKKEAPRLLSEMPYISERDSLSFPEPEPEAMSSSRGRTSIDYSIIFEITPGTLVL